MGLTIRRGPDGLPIFSFEDAPAARRAATPPPRPQRKIPPLIQYRYRAQKKSNRSRSGPTRSGSGAAHRDLAGPGPHGRVCRPRYASQVAADRGLDSFDGDAGRHVVEIERENAELVRFIGRSRPAPWSGRRKPAPGGGRGVLPDRLDREGEIPGVAAGPAARRRRPVAEAPLPADYARYREARCSATRATATVSTWASAPVSGRQRCPRQVSRRHRRRSFRPACTPSPRPGRDASPPYTPSLRREASEASAFERTTVDADGLELLAGVFSPLDEAPPPPELLEAGARPQKRGGMVHRKSVRAARAKDPRAITAEAERRAVLAATPERTRSGLFLRDAS